MFVKNYERIVEPLMKLLNKDEISWNPKEVKAFEHLKEAICQALVLVMIDFTRTFILECDASGNGIGDGLMQEVRCISFKSRRIKESIYTNLFVRWKCLKYYMH